MCRNTFQGRGCFHPAVVHTCTLPLVSPYGAVPHTQFVAARARPHWASGGFHNSFGGDSN
jgi:hypothetical protein